MDAALSAGFASAEGREPNAALDHSNVARDRDDPVKLTSTSPDSPTDDGARLGAVGVVPHHHRVRPRGTLSMRKRPSASVTAKKRCANTSTNALMCEWMSQNTRTMPGRSKRTAFDWPAA